MIYTEAMLKGRALGHTTVLRKIPGKAWLCACDICGLEYECPLSRICNGAAAKHGCGCRRQGNAGAPPPGPMPKGAMPFRRG